MSAKREHPHLIPTPAALEQADEDRTLDAALQDAVREIADSLRREEQQQRQRRIVVSWIPILVVGLIAVIVGFSLPRTFQGRPAKDAPVQERLSSTTPTTPVVPEPPASYTLRLPRGYEWQVDLIDLGNNRFQLKSDRNLNCLGYYELRDNRLEMREPVDPRLTEFVWQRLDGDAYRLIEQPPTQETGGDYLGATLERNSLDK